MNNDIELYVSNAVPELSIDLHKEDIEVTVSLLNKPIIIETTKDNIIIEVSLFEKIVDITITDLSTVYVNAVKLYPIDIKCSLIEEDTLYEVLIASDEDFIIMKDKEFKVKKDGLL